MVMGGPAGAISKACSPKLPPAPMIRCCQANTACPNSFEWVGMKPRLAPVAAFNRYTPSDLSVDEKVWAATTPPPSSVGVPTILPDRPSCRLGVPVAGLRDCTDPG